MKINQVFKVFYTKKVTQRCVNKFLNKKETITITLGGLKNLKWFLSISLTLRSFSFTKSSFISSILYLYLYQGY